MPKKPAPDSKSQSQKFIDIAREVEADEDESAFEDSLRRIATPKNVAHASDCQVYNGPAYAAGPCTCGALKGER